MFGSSKSDKKTTSEQDLKLDSRSLNVQPREPQLKNLNPPVEIFTHQQKTNPRPTVFKEETE